MQKPKKPRNSLKLMSLDTEDNSKGVVRMINFYDGVEHASFQTKGIDENQARKIQSEAVLWLLDRGTNLDIWCTNLQYDLINTFGPDLSVLEISYVGSRIISARLPNTKVFFKDTLNHWKISVKEMGERINLKKLEDDLFDKNKIPSDTELATRCHRDSEITFHFVNTMKEKYESIGAKLKATIGSTALEFFNKNYFKHTNKRHIKTKDIEFMLTGYYGGRTEIFHNQPVEGNVQYKDFNSMYPAKMRDNAYPVIGKDCCKYVSEPNYQNIGVMNATVECPNDLYLPYLPNRADNGSLLFPVGVFRGTWTYFEITEAIKLGYTVKKIHKCLEFTRGTFYPFRDFVQNMYNQRQEADAKGDTLLKQVFKDLPNNLYGKYGQGRDFTQLVPYIGPEQLKAGDAVLGDMVLTKSRHKHFPLHTNMIWSMLVTAYGRHDLYMAMKSVLDHKGLLIYCDTDSIIFESDLAIFKDSNELGHLKSEGNFKYAWFKLPKLYHLISADKKDKENKSIEHYKAKGVNKKKASDFFNTGTATFERPYKLRECLRRNLSPKRKVKLIPNYWHEVTKDTKKKYDKRKVLKKGETRPWDYSEYLIYIENQKKKCLDL